MQSFVLYARRLQSGEAPPDPLPGNLVPVNVTPEGRLQVDVASVEITLPGGGVNILSPIGTAGGVKVESISGTPLQVQFVTAQDVNITGPLSTGGGLMIAPTAGEPLDVQFPSIPDVKFATPQQVTFPSAQDVQFASPQQVTFPAAQAVNISSPVGAGGGVRVENNPGGKLAVDFGGSIPEITMAPGLTDPFSRLRTSEPVTLLDSKFLHDKYPSKWDELVAGAATSAHVANASEIRLTVGTASGDRAVRQSYMYVPYQPGKGRLAFLTGVISNEPKANCVSRIGLFDNLADKTAGFDSGGDGTFFEMSGSTMYCVVRSFVSGAVVEERAEQSAWNVDKMDGNGPSGITLAWTKSQIFVIDLEWLGVGTVTFGVAYNRRLYVVHQFHHANLIQGVYMRRADLPVRYEIENTGTTSGATYLRQICCTVISEGGYQPAGPIFSANFGTTIKQIGITETPLCALRLRPTSANRCMIRLTDIQIEMTTSDVLLVRVYTGRINLTGASWSDVNATHSMAQFDRSASSFAAAPGHVAILQFSGYVSPDNRRLVLPANSLYPVTSLTDIQGNPYPILLTAQNSSATADVLAALVWNESI